jgi:phosphoglycerate dehydrogenase-like enzyme
VTPHVSGMGSPAVRRRIGALVMDNVGRFAGKEALLHRVA